MKILTHEQGSQEWLDDRTGVLTGTRSKQAQSSRSKDLIYELIAEQLAPKKEFYVNEAMERGSLLEEDARMLYESITGYAMDEVGLCIHDEHDWLGVSPDGFFAEKKKYVGAVEIKCPDTKTHIKYFAEKKVPAEYKAQVLQYFIVNTNLEWLDFVSYDPRIQAPELQISIVRVLREELQDEIDTALEKLMKFREKWSALQEEIIF